MEENQTKIIPLGRKLVFAILLASSLVTTMLTSVTFFLEYQEGLKNLRKIFETIEKSNLSVISRIVWFVDKETLELQMNSILQSNDVVRLYIRDEEGIKFDFKSQNYNSNDGLMQKQLPLLNDEGEPFSDLIIVLTKENLIQRLWDNALIFLVTQAVKTFIVSLVIMALIKFFVIRHINEIHQFFRSFKLDDKVTKIRQTKNPIFPDEFYVLKSSINEMITHVEMTNNELKKYIDHVEEIVAEKTAKISTIMKNVPLGIFTISGQKEKILGEEYTQFLEQILGQEQLGGKTFKEVFLSKLELNSDSKSQLEGFLESSLGEPYFYYKLNHHLAPKEAEIKTPDGKKLIETDWAAIIQDEIVQQILVSVKDITEQKAMQSEVQEAKRELNIISQIIALDIEKFDRFIQDSFNFLNHNRSLIEKNPSFLEEVVKVLFINMHTLKGLARGYHFNYLTGIIHDSEQTYSELQKGNKEWNQQDLIHDLNMVEALVCEYQEVSEKKLGRQNSSSGFQLDDQTIHDIYFLLSDREIKGSEFQKVDQKIVEKKVLKNIEKIYFTDSHEIFKECLKSLPSLAKDLNKEEPYVSLIGTHRGLDRDGQEVLRNTLVHIIRNSMDHGIEKGITRENLGKEKIGTLTFILKNSENSLEIEFFDDGTGLDLAKIENLASQRGLISKSEDLSEQEIAELILKSGFSTADLVSEISGRGVGMDAVHTYLSQIGGSLEIELKEKNQSTGNTPFHLHIKIPEKNLSSLG